MAYFQRYFEKNSSLFYLKKFLVIFPFYGDSNNKSKHVNFLSENIRKQVTSGFYARVTAAYKSEDNVAEGISSTDSITNNKHEICQFVRKC